MRFSVAMLAPTLRLHATRLYLGMITGVHFFFISLDKKFEIQDIWFQKGDLHQLEGGSLVNASARACVATLLGCVVRTLCK